MCIDTETGALLFEKEIPKCWITHVQFNPVNSEQIMYNHEWPSFSCGIRRIWLYDHEKDEIIRIRTEGADTLGNPRGYTRKAEDWVCHEMWSDDGKTIIYHGGYQDGPAMVGKYDMESRHYWEIALPDDYDAYGHFTMDHLETWFVTVTLNTHGKSRKFVRTAQTMGRILIKKMQNISARFYRSGKQEILPGFHCADMKVTG